MKFLITLALLTKASAQWENEFNDGSMMAPEQEYLAPAGENCNSLVPDGGCVGGHRCASATPYTPTEEEIKAAMEAAMKATADAEAELKALVAALKAE